MNKTNSPFSYIIIVSVIAIHTGIIAYSLFDNKQDAKLNVDQSALMFVDIPSGEALSQTQALQSDSAPKSQPKHEKKVEHKKPVTKTQKKPAKEPDVTVTKTNKATTPVATNNDSNTKATTEPARNTQATNTSNNTPNKDNNNGQGTSAGNNKGSDNTSAPSGGGNTGSRKPGGYLNNPKPQYPPLSLENGEEGTVRMFVVVQPNGKPSNVRVEKSSGYSRLDRAAKKAVEQYYRFTPAMENGQPIAANYTFPVVFNLKNR